MPLISSVLSDEYSKLFDPDHFQFSGFPNDIQSAAQNWASAFSTYASNVIPASITSSAAEQAFISKFLTIDNTVPGSGVTILPQCFSDYATALATGMASGGFIGTPPPIPPNLTPAFNIGFNGGTGSQVASAMASILDTWLRTGTAVPVSGGSIVFWS